MKNVTFTSLFIGFLSVVAHAEPTNTSFESALNQQIQILVQHQDSSGAFYPESCSTKNMNFGCFHEKSIFMTALISETLLESKSPLASDILSKSLSHLQEQVESESGLMKYFEQGARMRFLAKPDVDDNAIILGTLNKASLQQSIAAQTYANILPLARIDTILREKQGTRSLDTDYFATWVKHQSPLFKDIDLVVNTNALFGIANLSQGQEIYRDDFTEICTSVNQVVEWSQGDDFKTLENLRHWYHLRKANYSQWYPSKYTAMFSIVRAYLDAKKPACLTPAYELIKAHLLSKAVYGQNIYDQALGAAALSRILVSEKLDLAPLRERAAPLVEMLNTSVYGKNPFFFYGVIGYIGDLDLVRALTVEVLSGLVNDANRGPASVSMDYFAREQQADGSFTKMIIPSSILYNTYMILLYEYMGISKEKAATIHDLQEYIFSQQRSDGSFGGYKEGADSASMSVLAYVTGKIAGENENSDRMMNLQKAIESMGGVKKIDFKAIPLLTLFNLNRYHEVFIPGITRDLMDLEKKLPWFRVLMFPVSYLFETKQFHELDESKFPYRIFHQRLRLPEPRISGVKNRFFQWASARMNTDGTFFDYTPTTVPMLMALQSDEHGTTYAKTIADGVKSLESFQVATPHGLMQTPGEASIGETFYIVNALLDMGVSSEDPVVLKGEQFLLSTQQASTGAWGFSKHNIYFPDTDDTSNVIFLLQRLYTLRGNAGMNPQISRGLDWLLDQQNDDGGFGTWQKTPGKVLGPLFNKIGKRSGLVVDESVMEHTSRIVVSLSKLRATSPTADLAYQKALRWLMSRQQPDGSFAGTWFIDYVFGTSMALTALSADPNPSAEQQEAAQKAISYILKNQRADGGFGESPDSFLTKTATPLQSGSPTQTGLIAAQLLTSLKFTSCKNWNELRAPVQKMEGYLESTRSTSGDGLWEDSNWTAVTFPKFEYLIYPYIQAVAPLQALTMIQNGTCQ